MKNYEVDISLKDIGKTVLWQYDRAVRLLAILKHIQVLYHCAVERFWDYWNKKVLSIDSCDAFGCAVWGLVLGVTRPTIVDETGNERYVVLSVYRRILKGAFYLMKAGSSYKDVLSYLEIVFGVDGNDSLSPWSIEVSEYGWYTNIDELNSSSKDYVRYYPRLAYAKGTVFLYEQEGAEEDNTRWLCIEDISVDDNASFAALIATGKITRTSREATIIPGEHLMLLRLYDPEGICRKIGSAPSDALSISIEYIFGDTKITAIATRKQKCGIYLVDNGDMSMTYGKTQYYNEMHRDQRFLFEQHFDELCPFPLGVKTNEVVNPVVWWFGVSEHDKRYDREYSPDVSYRRGERILLVLDNEDMKSSMFVSEFATWIVDYKSHVYTVATKYFLILEVRVDIPQEYNTMWSDLFKGGGLWNPGSQNMGFVKIVEAWGENDGSPIGHYESGIEYHKDEAFAVAMEDGYTKIFAANRDLPAGENRSFENIKDSIAEVNVEIPFPGTISDDRPPYANYETRDRLLYYDNPAVLFRVFPGQMFAVKRTDGFRSIFAPVRFTGYRIDVVMSGMSYEKANNTYYIEVDDDEVDTVMRALETNASNFGYKSLPDGTSPFEFPLPGIGTVYYPSGSIIQVDGQWRRIVGDMTLTSEQLDVLINKSAPMSQTVVAEFESYTNYYYRG